MLDVEINSDHTFISHDTTYIISLLTTITFNRPSVCPSDVHREREDQQVCLDHKDHPDLGDQLDLLAGRETMDLLDHQEVRARRVAWER